MMFDNLKKASWCTDCNAKTQNLFQLTIFEKLRLDCQKDPTKLDTFWNLSWSCFKTDHVFSLFEFICKVSWSTEFNLTKTSHVLCTILGKKSGKNEWPPDLDYYSV